MPETPTTTVSDAAAPRAGGTAVSDAVATWRQELARAGGTDPLTRYRDLPDGTLDLASAHPSGLAMFLAGRPTRLSSLFREPGALSDARRRARAIRLAATALEEEHGLRAGHLAVGMATWRSADAGGAQVTAPILLRPLTLRPRGAGHVDYDLDLGGPVRVNPALLRLLEQQGVSVDGGELVTLAHGRQGFDPAPAYARLAELADYLPGFSVRPRLVVSTFADLAPALVADLDRLAPQVARHDVLAALAGDAGARDRLAGRAADPVAPGGAPAQVLPLDPSQRAVVDAVLAGRSLRVEAPPGTGATQVAAAVLAALTAAGRRCLLVAAQRAEILGVQERLASVGLGDLVTTGATAPSPGAEAGPEDEPRRGRVQDAVRRLRRQHDALHAPRRPWGVSALAAMHELARLTSADPVPLTTVRLPTDVLRRLDRAARAEAAEALRTAAELGAFRARARHTPWYGAALGSEEEAASVLAAVARLSSELLPRLRADMGRLAAGAGLSAATSVEEWGRQLDLLVGVRDTLDVFTPAVYERPVGDMVAATASSAWRAEHGVTMGLWERRRWERHARELLRPGSHPGDLHAALVAAQEQRAQWQRMSTGGGWPRVPAGLAAADAGFAAVVTELSRLERVLAGTPDGATLLAAPLPELERRLDRLAADSDALDTLPRRTAALAALRRFGLDDLVEDLRARACEPHRVTAELELAWWRSLLQQMLTDDEDLRDVDGLAHQATLEALQVAERGRRAAVARRLRDGLAVAGLPPCPATSPLALPQEVPPGAELDVVVLAGAHRIGAAEGALAVGRARQVVVIGDPGGLPPATVSLRADEGPGEPEVPVRSGVLELLDGALPTLRLARQHRMPAQLCAPGDAAARGAGRDRTDQVRVPAPPGEPRVTFDLVPDGVGHPVPDGGVESVDAEVERVVALVLEHVRSRPAESLAVVALTRHHARRVADALRADLPDHPDLARWLARPTAEPFVVTDVDRAEDAVRDAVLLTVGVGRTPHGRVLHRFGRLDAEAGERRLGVALTRARRRLTVVSCLQAGHLDPERLRTPGARGLHALLRALDPEVPDPADVPGTDQAPSGGLDDPLLQDLAARLEARGRAVQRGTPGGPDLVVTGEGTAVAVLTDVRPEPDDRALLERELLLPEQLARFGWPVVSLRAVGLFTDPDAQVSRVVEVGS